MGHTTKSSWVPSVPLRVDAEGVEPAALLLGADGRVRGDADMVFEGQPVHPSGAVRYEAVALVVELSEVEAAVERIVVAGSAGAGVLSVVAPDGEAVASCTVTGAPDAAAVVFAEFFRESGGWKFARVGQGYASGLAGLVTAYGVEVAEEEPAVAGPVPLTGVAKVPGQAPPMDGAPAAGEPVGTPAGEQVTVTSPAAGGPVTPSAPAGPFPPADRPYELVEGWEFGPVFEPFVAEGFGNDVIALDDRVGDGPVLVEVAQEGRGYLGLFTLDRRNKDESDYLLNDLLPEFRGSTFAQVPKGRPLRMRLDAENRWILRVKPLAAARRLEGTVHGYGPELLLYLGNGADLRVEFQGSPEDGRGYAGIQSYGVGGRTGGRLPDMDLLLNEIGPLRQTVPVPRGPQLLHLRAECAWTFTVQELD
ncbi:TerD family protein [Streptomyces sp. NBC_00233]|uniref:TerD family protein n=1 Tax=Streptomyces sp. NBC_00233 TaxID=2975686 RepID=UPI0022566EBF|nr:TerD family protein [Streptomyces sp. NBC_00233]MCX5226057.1 TerD family protein [Streptomyces sp. NBC_00233]